MIRVAGQLAHDRFEVLLDGQLRDYYPASRLAWAETSGVHVIWDIKRPTSYEAAIKAATTN